jgi:hypothetical protein
VKYRRPSGPKHRSLGASRSLPRSEDAAVLRYVEDAAFALREAVGAASRLGHDLRATSPDLIDAAMADRSHEETAVSSPYRAFGKAELGADDARLHHGGHCSLLRASRLASMTLHPEGQA